MYFYYPVWFGSMSDPSMVPPAPAFVRRAHGHRFRPERPPSFKCDGANDPFVSLFAEDDIAVDYDSSNDPDYVHPTTYPPPPPPSLPKRDTEFEHWTYNRTYDPPPAYQHPRPRSSVRGAEFLPFSHPRSHSYGHPPYSHEYLYSHSHSGPHWVRYPYSYPWSSREASDAWSTKQKTAWEDWQSKAKDDWEEWKNRAKEDWEDWQAKTKAGRGSRHARDGGPGLPSRDPKPRPAGPDGAKDRTRYAQSYWYEQAQRESDRGRPRWGAGYRPPPWANAQHRSFSAPRSEMTLTEAFALYCKVWAVLLAPNDGNARQLKFRHIPWPQYPPPRSVEDIDAQKVRAFLTAGGRSLKICLREALLRFHPDKTAALLSRVVEEDKIAVAATCEAVTRCLGQLMKSATL